ncbi:CRISPR-associated protein Cse1 [Erythrobacter sp. Dej080120_24]|uniref:hypothetical protein n=1 Tax=Erythrobacter sp. Dej080120_24 TaxID=3024837 RepID=UPI00291CFA85|nr:CRISPR-associated protein Cse1 [Erythrobacter sp. Dej080120_24]
MHNLLLEPTFTVRQGLKVTLPGLLALLASDEIDDLTALRPHQMPAWHMFIVQLAALAMDRAAEITLPQNEARWRNLLSNLTADTGNDAAWTLVVPDLSSPAFLQPPCQPDVVWTQQVSAPDSLDVLILAKNHDLKQSQMRLAEAEDWVFALVAMQTGEGFGGKKNYGIARMNGGSSSRPMLSRVPVKSETDARLRPGAWFCRDVAIALRHRNRVLADNQFGYMSNGDIGLVWTVPWVENEQLSLAQLDPLFIEVCRRVRLMQQDHGIVAKTGISSLPRIAASEFKGNLGDIWAPIHRRDLKSLTLNEGEFDYRRMVDLLVGPDWHLPESAQRREDDRHCAILAAALARSQGRTSGYKERVIPLPDDMAVLIDTEPQIVQSSARILLDASHEVNKALRVAIALAVANGDKQAISSGDFRFADSCSDQLDKTVDRMFFQWLWPLARAKAAREVEQEKELLARQVTFLVREATSLLKIALPTVPCSSAKRREAERSAERFLQRQIEEHFGSLITLKAH